MSSKELPFYFEPVRWLVGKIREPTYEEEEFLVEPRSELGADYFFKKVISEHEDEFETVDVPSKLLEAVIQGISSTETKLKEQLSPIISSETIEKVLEPIRTRALDRIHSRLTFRGVPRRFHFHKESPSVIFSVTSNLFYVISENKKDATTLVTDIKSKFEKLNEVTKDFGLELLRFLTSREYQSFALENLENVKKIDYGKPRNAFEEKVMKTCGKVTSSFLSNVNIEFDEPAESFEYDVFLGFPGGRRVIVEPKDYETIKEEMRKEKIATETLKSKIILATQDKARRLDARSIVIVKGFPDETFLKLKKIADSRRVSLMNEKDYEVGLPTELCSNLLSAITPYRRTWRRPSF